MNQTNLRPLSLGEILQETIRLYIRDWRVYLSVVATIQVPLGIITAIALAYFGVSAFATDPLNLVQSAPELLPGLTLALLVVSVLNVLLTISAIYGPVIEAVHERYSGSTPNFNSAMFFGWREFFDLIWASLVAGLPMTLLSLLIISLPAIVFVATKWLFFAQIIVIEKEGAVASLRHSWHLVDGFFWRSLGIALLLAAITMGLASVPSSAAGLLFLTPNRTAFVLLAAILGAASIACTIVATPIQMIGLTVAYYDLVARKAKTLS